LLCTYLYAAFSLRCTEDGGLSAEEAAALDRWRQAMLRVAIDEMAHLTAVWNITAALGGSPRFGRGNFPLDPGALPASVVVKLAPFGEAVLQHFIHLERPQHSSERDGDGFQSELPYSRSYPGQHITPMVIDYDCCLSRTSTARVARSVVSPPADSLGLGDRVRSVFVGLQSERPARACV